MKNSVKEWIKKAEGDGFSALREYRARKNPNYDAACFHAQQCIEKYLKAVLELHEIDVRRIHDLPVLLNDCLRRYPLWEAMRDDMRLLSQYAVQFRYPGQSATREQAKLAVKAMRRSKADLRVALGKLNGA
jgi:HEPN domain-containing protein